jgi:hypothetical protein
MNPTNYEQPGLSLPEPLGAQGAATNTAERATTLGIESVPNSGGQQPSMVGVHPANAASLNTAYPAIPQNASALAPVAGVVPIAADDGDLIEKEWVAKAKAIVDSTKDDPREQTREMNYFKADYLKKRYNKDIKVSES